MYSLQCAVFYIHCTLYCTQCTVNTILLQEIMRGAGYLPGAVRELQEQVRRGLKPFLGKYMCTLCSVYSTLYSVHSTLYSVHFTYYSLAKSVHCIMYIVHCTVSWGDCSSSWVTKSLEVFTERCGVCSVGCRVYSVYSEFLNVVALCVAALKKNRPDN